MDPNTTNTGATPTPPPTPPEPGPDSGQTRYFPPQEGYRAQEATPAPQPIYPQQPVNRPNASPYSWTGFHRDRDRTMLAIILIGLGVLFFLGMFPVSDFFPNTGGLILLVLGGVFLYAYYSTRPGYRVGFLIPGAILLGLGVGVALENYSFVSGGNLVPLTLGLGFCLIWLLERKHWWALIPGGILVVVGLSDAVGVGLGVLWPVVLIAIGVYFLYDRSRHQSVR